MAKDQMSATTVIDAPAEAIFAVLADPSKHAAIDGTGWVTAPVDREPLTAVGQVFRMSMYHPDHPDGRYETANEVEVVDAPVTISWKTGYDTGDGTLAFGGWCWRYDLARSGPSTTTVTLTYDWSAAPDDVRARIGFPPFPPEHLQDSLAHLAAIVA